MIAVNIPRTNCTVMTASKYKEEMTVTGKTAIVEANTLRIDPASANFMMNDMISPEKEKNNTTNHCISWHRDLLGKICQ